jgi:hypothetical protein
MRNLVLVLTALAVLAPAARAQGGAWADKMFKGPATHDFGSVPRGSQLYHRFPMANIWAVPVEITHVRTSCGCVTVTPSTKTLQPRDSGHIDVLMDAHKFTGHKSVSIYLTLGPQYVSTATLRVEANSRADVVFNPGQINFGVVQRGQSAQQNIEVEYAGVLDWRVSDVEKSGAPVDVAIEQMYRSPGRVGYRLKTTLQPDAPAGLLKHEIFLRTNDPVSPLVPVLVEAMIQAPLTVKPNHLTLDDAKVGQAVTRRVNVFGSKPFKVLAVDGQGDGIQASIPPNAATVQTITITCNPTKAGAFQRQLQIRSDLPGQTPVTVTIDGTVADP